MDFHYEPLIFFASYLSGRRLECIDKSLDLRSDAFQITCGIPQGSTSDVLPLCKIIMFADDVVIFSSHRDLAVLFHNLECTLQVVNFWYSRNLLALNEEKCQYMLFLRTGSVISDGFSLLLSGLELKRVVQFKYLGFILDENLLFNKHVKTLPLIYHIFVIYFLKIF